MKESELKKGFKEFFKRGKKLRKDSVFMIHDNLLISANINDGETPGVYITKFFVDYSYIFNIFKNNTIFVGNIVNKLLIGKGLHIELNGNNLLMKSSNGIFSTDDMNSPLILTNNSSIEESILGQFYKHPKLFDSVNHETYEVSTIKMKELLATKQFTYEVPFESVESYVKITNKMIKNFDKNTESLVIEVSDDISNFITYDSDTPNHMTDTSIKIVRIITTDQISENYSYYCILDK